MTVTEASGGKLLFQLQVSDVVDGVGDLADIADLRGLFFDVADASLLSGLTVAGDAVTGFKFLANAVNTLGNDVTMNGPGPDTYDAAVEFGSQGRGKDDIQSTSFTLSHASKPLTLEWVEKQNFGVRLTSVSINGDHGDRSGSLKLTGVSPFAGALAPPTPPPPPPPFPPGSTSGHDDLIEGGAGNDTIDGGQGNDEIQGEGGDDVIVGGSDNGSRNAAGSEITIGDNLYGNDGADTFLFRRGDGVDLIWDVQPGADAIRVSGYTLADAKVVLVGAVTNQIATYGHQKIAVLLGTGDAIVFNDFPNASSSAPLIYFDNGQAWSAADLMAAAKGSGTAAGASAELQRLIIGGSSNDQLSGSPQSDYIRGLDGDDVIHAGAGDDDIHGNAGDDVLFGGDGADWVVGGKGADRLYGEDGADLVLGNLGDDTLSGGAGDDILRGGRDNDSLSGGDGNDWLSGDRGDDTLVGGAGADIFHTFQGAELDRVLDFNAGEGDRVFVLPGTTYSVSQAGADTVIDLGGGDRMVLVGVSASSLPAGWIFGA
ncbi:hypothetical protein [Phenylobacterium sp.]|uniref:calcium-binding protein n=1 Tax=Phenylobacterium sp. TaxID=1871053 RepID=UPI0035AF03F0